MLRDLPRGLFCYTRTMKYKAVLLDMDGVIVDSEPLHVAAFQATLKNYGHELSEEDYKNHFAGKTDEAGFRQYFQFVNESADINVIMDAKAKKYLELAGDQLVPYPGIVSLIRELATQVPLALVTGSLKAEADVALRTFAIADCFSVLVTAEDIQNSKPNPEGYLKAARLLAVNPNDCVVVEDSPSGVKAAHSAKIDCIAITNTHTADSLELATHVVDHLSLSMF
jgi:beta-phosphoglucomutase